jgi:hypothetical protein
MGDERRSSTRFSFKKNEIQIFSDDAILFGEINDISKGGLSFKYTPIKNEKMTTKSINILVKIEDRFNLYHLNCRTIVDISTIEEGEKFLGCYRRKCGIKYSWLKEPQNKKLYFLLDHYVVRSFNSLF